MRTELDASNCSVRHHNRKRCSQKARENVVFISKFTKKSVSGLPQSSGRVSRPIDNLWLKTEVENGLE